MDFEPDRAGFEEIELLGDGLITRLGAQIAEDVRRYCPGGPAGDLGLSVEPTQTRVYIGTDHWYPHEYGSPPHVIEPQGKEALAWPGAEHPVARVHHPGTPETAMMRHALYTQTHLPS
jgi:hypothetical protein